MYEWLVVWQMKNLDGNTKILGVRSRWSGSGNEVDHSTVVDTSLFKAELVPLDQDFLLHCVPLHVALLWLGYSEKDNFQNYAQIKFDMQ